MDKDKFDELIERAKQCSKDDFIRFVTGIYDVDECVFEHMRDVPIIAPWDGNVLVTTSLSTKTEEEIQDIVYDFITDELGNEDVCRISLDKIAVDFTVEELEEYQNKIDSGELKLDYNEIIVYNEIKLQKQYNELVKANFARINPKKQEEVNQIFVNDVKGIITHEICYLNANYLVTDVSNNKFDPKEITDTKISTGKQENTYTEKEKNIVNQANYIDRYEVLIDTLRKMINNYKEGDSIEDCLFRIIENREEKFQNKELDDREILIMYVLFPEELTEWTIFGAYDFIRENKLKKMIVSVCGTDIPLQFGQFKKSIEEYVATLEEGILSDKKIEMLEMLGVSISRKIYKEDMKEVVTFKKALNKSSDGLLEVKEDDAINNYDNTNYLEVINNKKSFIKGIFYKILNVFRK